MPSGTAKKKQKWSSTDTKKFQPKNWIWHKFFINFSALCASRTWTGRRLNLERVERRPAWYGGLWKVIFKRTCVVWIVEQCDPLRASREKEAEKEVNKKFFFLSLYKFRTWLTMNSSDPDVLSSGRRWWRTGVRRKNSSTVTTSQQEKNPAQHDSLLRSGRAICCPRKFEF